MTLSWSAVFLKGHYFDKAPTQSTVEARVYLQTCVYRSDGFFRKVFGWEGFGFFGVFVLETLKLGGLKVPSTFGIKDLL